MDSTSVVGITDLLKTVDLTTLAVVTGVLGLFHPWITDLANGLYFDKIVNEKVRKSSIYLFGAAVGFGLAILTNVLGSLNLSVLICFLIGSGFYTTVGEGVYRLRNHFTKDKTTDVQPG